MSLDSIAQVTITTDSVGLQQAGFGVPLVLSFTASWSNERIRFYTSIAEVTADFAAGTPENLMATRLFSQAVKPERIAIGKCLLQPTQRFILTPTVANTTRYRVIIDGTNYDYTSDGSATNDEITDALATAINLDTGTHGFTASTPGSSGSHVLTLTGVIGTWGSVAVEDIALLSLTQNHADPGVATDLAAIALENNAWYFILCSHNSKAVILAIADYAEANKKFLIAGSCDSNNATIALGGGETTSVAGQAKATAYAKTHIFYSHILSEFPDAGLVGRFGPLDPGSENWLYKTLVGATQPKLTSTHKTNLNAKKVGYYETLASVNVVVGEGAVSSNERIDVIRFIDWLTARLQERIISALIAADKIPYTDDGIAIIEAEVRAQLDEAIAAGGIIPGYTVTVPKAANVATQDKTDRILRNVKFEATLSGAINKIVITGVVSVG